MKEIFEIDNRNYNFHHDFSIKLSNMRSVCHGTGIASFISPKIWDTLPNSCKDTTSLKGFKVHLKKGGFLKTVPADYVKHRFNV